VPFYGICGGLRYASNAKPGEFDDKEVSHCVSNVTMQYLPVQHLRVFDLHPEGMFQQLAQDGKHQRQEPDTANQVYSVDLRPRLYM